MSSKATAIRNHKRIACSVRSRYRLPHRNHGFRVRQRLLIAFPVTFPPLLYSTTPTLWLALAMPRTLPSLLVGSTRWSRQFLLASATRRKDRHGLGATRKSKTLPAPCVDPLLVSYIHPTDIHRRTTVTTMNPPPVLDNPALRLINALNSSYESEPSQSIALSQSSISSRPATTITTTTSEPVSSPKPEEEESPPAHGGAPVTVFNFSQPQPQRAPDAPVSETSSAEEDDDMPAENNDRDRKKTSLEHEQPRRVPGVIYMGSRRSGREVPLLRFLPR